MVCNKRPAMSNSDRKVWKWLLRKDSKWTQNRLNLLFNSGYLSKILIRCEVAYEWKISKSKPASANCKLCVSLQSDLNDKEIPLSLCRNALKTEKPAANHCHFRSLLRCSLQTPDTRWLNLSFCWTHASAASRQLLSRIWIFFSLLFYRMKYFPRHSTNKRNYAKTQYIVCCAIFVSVCLWISPFIFSICNVFL